MKVYVLVLDPESNYAEGWAHVLGVFASEEALNAWITVEESKMETEEKRNEWFHRLRSYEEEVRQ